MLVNCKYYGCSASGMFNIKCGKNAEEKRAAHLLSQNSAGPASVECFFLHTPLHCWVRRGRDLFPSKGSLDPSGLEASLFAIILLVGEASNDQIKYSIQHKAPPLQL